MKQYFDALLESIHKLNFCLLDNIGIKINMSELPSMKSLQYAQSLLWDAPWLLRAVREIYFKIKPQVYNDRTELLEYLRRCNQQEVLNKVLEEGKKVL